MTDRELLEMAAKAAGIEIHESDDGTLQRRPVWCMTYYVQGQPYGETRWDPLHDDAQALRLAVRLFLWEAVRDGYQHVDSSSDLCASTRRAIVRAAAAIGKSMG